MTFDEALADYQKRRTEIRELQSDLDKLLRQQVDTERDIKSKKGEYKAKYKGFIRARDALRPELDKEANSVPLPADLLTELEMNDEDTNADDSSGN